MTKSQQLLLACAMVITAPALGAPDHATPAEAKAMLDKAVAYYKAEGRKKALADFNTRKAPFADRDLYVFCIGPDHKLVADGQFHEFIGQSADQIKDSAGKSVGAAGWDIARKNGAGVVRYQWLNPTSHLIEHKISYFAQAGEDVCAVGTYDAP